MRAATRCTPITSATATRSRRGWCSWSVGLFFGALASAWLAHRSAIVVERGPRAGVPDRLGLAFIGGALAGVGAKLALGCTSGQALTGGALLNAGSWTFMLMVFAGGYGAAWFVRKQWT